METTIEFEDLISTEEMAAMLAHSDPIDLEDEAVELDTDALVSCLDDAIDLEDGDDISLDLDVLMETLDEDLIDLESEAL